ncbi:transglutaminase-like domain-containing protein [Tenacibaculum aiptasiae]|uniref:transglutaminase-like domain-containing protein n=1 Tax=Tenacibaculum aiptasiae TaxID=426481 RepID=UPI00232E1EEF|nr:transglutaminase-like domain-containing protein [Tenacibaculum aiptasiae]
MDIATVNKALYRNVKTHTKYDEYFTKTPCTSTYLGEFTTTGGMRQMVEWALKYKDFSKEISKVLKGRNLKQTVANIYQFLYDHVQYQADGYDQQLRSPSCTWNSRLEGIDCKSYSVFASTILINLNIPHSFRKVKQPSEPNRWSHVYVKIPSGNQTLIIDPTKRVNTEVEYIQKEDMEVKLPYHGLHAALPSVPNQQAETVSNFRKFLAELNRSGVPKTVTQKIEYEVRRSTDRGIDPYIDLQPTHIVVNKVMIPYGVSVELQGMGWVATATTAVTSLFKSGFFSGLFGGQTSADEVMRDSMSRIQGMITKVTSKGLGAEAHTNEVLYNIGWLRAMHVRNGGAASSTRMKEGNAGAVKNIDDAIDKILSSLSSKASFTKEQKTTTFPGSNPLLGVNTHSNPGSYFVIRITGGVRNANQGGGVNNYNSNQGGGSHNNYVGTTSNTGGVPQNYGGNTNSNNNPNQNPNNNPNQNKPMSTTTKVAIGGAAVLAVGTAVYLATKDKK